MVNVFYKEDEVRAKIMCPACKTEIKVFYRLRHKNETCETNPGFKRWLLSNFGSHIVKIHLKNSESSPSATTLTSIKNIFGQEVSDLINKIKKEFKFDIFKFIDLTASSSTSTINN